MGKFLSNNLNVSKSIYLFTSILLILLSLGINVKTASASTKEKIYEISFNNRVKGYFKGIDLNEDNLLVKSEITDFNLLIKNSLFLSDSNLSNIECTSKNLREFKYHIPDLKVKSNINHKKIYIDCLSKYSSNEYIFILDNIDKSSIEVSTIYKEKSRSGSISFILGIDPSGILIKENSELKIPNKTKESGYKYNCDNPDYTEINLFDHYIYCT